MANGYLVDQFIQDTCNQRSDEWGGSYENSSRFALEATKAVVEDVGSDRTIIRLSPWSLFQGMKMEVPAAQERFSNLTRGLKEYNLTYLHLIESTVIKNVDCDKVEGLEFAFDIWQSQPAIVVAGGFNGDKVRKAVDEEYGKFDRPVVFGRHFVSTPNLVFHLQHSIDPNTYDRSTFYAPLQRKGYTDYPFSPQLFGAVSAGISIIGEQAMMGIKSRL